MDTIDRYESQPLNKLFRTLAIPSILGHVAGSLCIVFEGIFVGSVLGANALAASSLVMPYILISNALSDMVAAGASVQISIHLGMKEEKKAMEIFSFACLLIEVIALLVSSFFLLFMDKIVLSMGAQREVALLAKQYASIFAILSPLSMLFFAVDDFLRICGKIKFSMYVNIGVSVLNCILMTILIGHYKMGLMVSSAIYNGCYALGAFACIIPLLSGKLALKFTKPKVEFKMVLRIFANGLNVFFSNISVSAVVILTNFILLKVSGTLAVAAFAVYDYIDGVARNVILGMANGLTPAIGYNYGADNSERVKGLSIRLLLYGAMASLGIFLFVRFNAGVLAPIFCKDGDIALLDMSVHTIKLCCLSYIIMWLPTLGNMILSSLDRPSFASLMAFAKTLVFPVVSIMALSSILGLDGVWYSFITSESLSAVLTSVFLLVVYKELRRNGLRNSGRDLAASMRDEQKYLRRGKYIRGQNYADWKLIFPDKMPSKTAGRAKPPKKEKSAKNLNFKKKKAGSDSNG